MCRLHFEYWTRLHKKFQKSQISNNRRSNSSHWMRTIVSSKPSSKCWCRREINRNTLKCEIKVHNVFIKYFDQIDDMYDHKLWLFNVYEFEVRLRSMWSRSALCTWKYTLFFTKYFDEINVKSKHTMFISKFRPEFGGHTCLNPQLRFHLIRVRSFFRLQILDQSLVRKPMSDIFTKSGKLMLTWKRAKPIKFQLL